VKKVIRTTAVIILILGLLSYGAINSFQGIQRGAPSVELSDASSLSTELNYHNADVPAHEQIVTAEDIAAHFHFDDESGLIKFVPPNTEMENRYVYFESYDRATDALSWIELGDDNVWRVDVEEIRRALNERDTLRNKKYILITVAIISISILVLIFTSSKKNNPVDEWADVENERRRSR